MLFSPRHTATVLLIIDIIPPIAAPYFAPSKPALCDNLFMSLIVDNLGLRRASIASAEETRPFFNLDSIFSNFLSCNSFLALVSSLIFLLSSCRFILFFCFNNSSLTD